MMVMFVKTVRSLYNLDQHNVICFPSLLFDGEDFILTFSLERFYMFIEILISTLTK